MQLQLLSYVETQNWLYFRSYV